MKAKYLEEKTIKFVTHYILFSFYRHIHRSFLLFSPPSLPHATYPCFHQLKHPSLIPLSASQLLFLDNFQYSPDYRPKPLEVDNQIDR